jgi:hypothetical protein
MHTEGQHHPEHSLKAETVPRVVRQTRADLVGAYLVAHGETSHCVLCIAAATGLSREAVQAASMIVRGWSGMQETQDECAVCGVTRLVFKFWRRPRR